MAETEQLHLTITTIPINCPHHVYSIRRSAQMRILEPGVFYAVGHHLGRIKASSLFSSDGI